MRVWTGSDLASPGGSLTEIVLAVSNTGHIQGQFGEPIQSFWGFLPTRNLICTGAKLALLGGEVHLARIRDDVRWCGCVIGDVQRK